MHAPGFDLAGADRERGQKARARGADVERPGPGRAELVGDLRSGVRHHFVGRGGGHQHKIDLADRDGGPLQRRRGRVGRVRDQALIRGGHAACPDPGPADDPLVGDADPRRDLRVRDHRVGKADADRRDRGAEGQDRRDRLAALWRGHGHTHTLSERAPDANGEGPRTRHAGGR